MSEAPLRVVHLAKRAPPARGGIETVVGELLAGCAKQQRITVECHCYADRSGHELLAPNVALVRQRINAVVASAPISLPLLGAWHRSRHTADVVHVHLPNPWAALLILLVPTRAAVVASVHGASTRYGALQRPHAALMRRLLRRADAIVVSASANVEVLALAAYRDKVHVVPYGIDPQRLRVPDGHPPTSGPTRVLFVGRFVYYKGLDTLLNAAAAINAELVLLGDGPLYPALHGYVNENGLSGKVRFVRDADDVALARHLAACALLVLPSSTTSESFGLTVLEAMAAGKPVVVSGLGTGLDQLVATTGVGRVVPPRDPEALAQAINGLLADPTERERLAAAGRRAFARYYTRDAMTARILEVYRRVSSGRHRTAPRRA